MAFLQHLSGKVSRSCGVPPWTPVSEQDFCKSGWQQKAKICAGSCTSWVQSRDACTDPASRLAP